MLTPRETRVLQLAACGFTAQETADQLHRSIETVKTQRRILIGKLGARNITGAVAIGFREGVLP